MDPTDKRLSLHCTQVMPTQIFKSNKKEWIRMVSKTLTALKTENPNGIPQDDLIEQVRIDPNCPQAVLWPKFSRNLTCKFLGGAIQFGNMASIVFKKI